MAAVPGDGVESVLGDGSGGSIRYSTVAGYFLQDDPGTDDGGFDYVCVFYSLVPCRVVPRRDIPCVSACLELRSGAPIKEVT
jgi:hypothetical protein